MQDCMQRRYDGYSQFLQESQDVTPSWSAENTILMLKADEIYVIYIQKVGGASIGFKVLLEQLKSNARGISVAGFVVVDWQSNAIRRAEFSRYRFAQIGGKGRNAALARHVVADEGDAVEC